VLRIWLYDRLALRLVPCPALACFQANACAALTAASAISDDLASTIAAESVSPGRKTCRITASPTLLANYGCLEYTGHAAAAAAGGAAHALLVAHRTTPSPPIYLTSTSLLQLVAVVAAAAAADLSAGITAAGVLLKTRPARPAAQCRVSVVSAGA
jgi:hypothetical protein